MTNAQIKAKLQSILERVVALLPPDKRQYAMQRTYIAGGAIVSLVLDEEPADYDVWFDDQATANLFTGLISGRVPPARCEVLANTQNAVTLKFDTGEVLQLVMRFIGPPSRVFESFDFLHCQTYYRPEMYLGAVQEPLPGVLELNRELIEKKQLRFNKGKEEYALNSLKRLCKFVSRGWTPDNEGIMNLYRAIQKSQPIDDPAEHAKQTIGYYGSSFK